MLNSKHGKGWYIQKSGRQCLPLFKFDYVKFLRMPFHILTFTPFVVYNVHRKGVNSVRKQKRRKRRDHIGLDELVKLLTAIAGLLAAIINLLADD